MKRNCPSLKTPSVLELSTLQNYWIDCHRVFWEWVGDCAMHCSPSLAPLVCIDAKIASSGERTLKIANNQMMLCLQGGSKHPINRGYYAA